MDPVIDLTARIERIVYEVFLSHFAFTFERKSLSCLIYCYCKGTTTLCWAMASFDLGSLSRMWEINSGMKFNEQKAGSKMLSDALSLSSSAVHFSISAGNVCRLQLAKNMYFQQQLAICAVSSVIHNSANHFFQARNKSTRMLAQ